jgi:hypothetical protein
VTLADESPLDLADDRGCDFCGCPPVTAYPARALSLAGTMTHLDGSRVEVDSHQDAGDWLACAPCERLIERERYDRLADRAARHADRVARGEVPTCVPRKIGKRFRSEASASVRQMVAAFAAARRGEAAGGNG